MTALVCALQASRCCKRERAKAVNFNCELEACAVWGIADELPAGICVRCVCAHACVRLLLLRDLGPL